MAQWLGQFSGLTHESKVKDAEDSLRVAVAALRSAATDRDVRKKRGAVDRLAMRLLRARLKLAGALLSAAKEPRSGASPDARAEEIASLERKGAEVRAGGLDAILREFGAPDPPRE